VRIHHHFRFIATWRIGKNLYEAIESFDVDANANGKKAEFAEILADAKEHAGHISDNDGNMDHQRAHFDMLSVNMKDLIAIAGAYRKLYHEYCPCTMMAKVPCGSVKAAKYAILILEAKCSNVEKCKLKLQFNKKRFAHLPTKWLERKSCGLESITVLFSTTAPDLVQQYEKT